MALLGPSKLCWAQKDIKARGGLSRQGGGHTSIFFLRPTFPDRSISIYSTILHPTNYVDLWFWRKKIVWIVFLDIIFWRICIILGLKCRRVAWVILFNIHEITWELRQGEWHAGKGGRVERWRKNGRKDSGIYIEKVEKRWELSLPCPNFAP